MIKSLHFFLYSTGQFPDFKLLSSKDDAINSGISSKALISIKKLQLSIDPASSLDEELRSLSAFPIEQFLFILGPNVQEPLHIVLFKFRCRGFTTVIVDPSRSNSSPLFSEVWATHTLMLYLNPLRLCIFMCALKPIANSAAMISPQS
uniref:Uncharacterized protein n=1 Tax=Taenia asiatica TaxID=60517 RepID=A0A0R3W8X3_TAEAS